MKIKLRYFLYLLLLGAAQAQTITIPTGTTGGGTCSVTTGTGQLCAAPSGLTVQVQVNDTLIVFVGTTSATTAPVISGCGVTTWPAPIQQTGSATLHYFWWIVPRATVATPSGCGVTVSGLAALSGVTFQIYRGVGAIGTPNEDNTVVASSVNMFSPYVVPTAANSLMLAVFSASATSTFTQNTTQAPTGTVRRATAGTAMGDIPSVTVGTQIRTVVASSATVSYMRAAVELIPASPNRIAEQADAMHTLVMNNASSKDYILQSGMVSATWCTWFMPVNTGRTELQPYQNEVNGQTEEIPIPAWQMTRICRDPSGNFWASPPLLPGPGISITPSPKGLTISSVGTPGASGMVYIAGGTTTIPGDVTLQPDSCATLASSSGTTTPSASGVRQSDVVTFSLQPSASAWNNGKTYFHPIAYAGTISWRGCNLASTVYTPSQRDVNWYVARPSAGALAAHHKAASLRKKVAKPTK